MNSTLNFGIPPVLVFLLEVYCKVERLLIGLTAQQKGTTAQWYSNKTSLIAFPLRQQKYASILRAFLLVIVTRSPMVKL